MSFLAEEKRVSLEEWLDYVSKDPDLGVLTAVNVHHIAGGALGDEIGGKIFQIGHGWSVKETAAELLGKCRMYAQGLSGAQTFQARAFYGKAEPSARMHFDLTGRTRFANGATEEPTATGAQAQGQRLTELIVQGTQSERRQLLEAYQNIARDLNEELRRERLERRDAVETVYRLVQERITENNAQRMRELEFVRNTEERRKLILLLPAIINYVTGKKVIPEGQAALSTLEAAANFMRKLPENQKGKAFELMPAELKMMVGVQIKEIADRQDAEEEQIRLEASAKASDAKEGETEISQLIESAIPRLQ